MRLYNRLHVCHEVWGVMGEFGREGANEGGVTLYPNKDVRYWASALPASLMATFSLFLLRPPGLWEQFRHFNELQVKDLLD